MSRFAARGSRSLRTPSSRYSLSLHPYWHYRYPYWHYRYPYWHYRYPYWHYRLRTPSSRYSLSLQRCVSVAGTRTDSDSVRRCTARVCTVRNTEGPSPCYCGRANTAMRFGFNRVSIGSAACAALPSLLHARRARLCQRIRMSEVNRFAVLFAAYCSAGANPNNDYWLQDPTVCAPARAESDGFVRLLSVPLRKARGSAACPL
jgi:hypothetical protein